MTMRVKMPFVECMMCHEMIPAALMQHHVPVCVDCASDVSAADRVQARLDSMYDSLIEAIAGLCTCAGDASCTCVDAARYHQVWLAQQELRAPVSPHTSVQQTVQRRDKLRKQLRNTRKKGDCISEIMRMQCDIDAHIALLHTLEIAHAVCEV